MVVHFRRRPIDRDCRALVRALALERAHRREEILSSIIGLAALLIGSIVLTSLLHAGDGLLPYSATPRGRLIEGALGFALVATIGVVVGLPTLGGRSRIYFFDRQILRMTRTAIAALDAALKSEVHVVRCDASEVVGLIGDDEDVDRYAFQVESDRIFVLNGLADGWVADGDEFPCTSFEIVTMSPYGTDYVALHCLGEPLAVRRLLPTSVLRDGVDGELPGTLEDLMALAR
jgi:hypothetical protein